MVPLGACFRTHQIPYEAISRKICPLGLVSRHPKKPILKRLLYNESNKGKMYLHGMLFLAAWRSLQQRHETQQAITIINITETHPTMRRSWRLIWQLRPANQGWHSHRTLEGPFVLSPSSTHFPFLLQRSHSVVVAESKLLDVVSFFFFFFPFVY